MLPVTRFTGDELSQAIEQVKQILGSQYCMQRWASFHVVVFILTKHSNFSSAEVFPLPSGTSISEAPHISQKSMEMTVFRKYWSHGIPVVVIDVPILSDFNPGYFIQKYGAEKVDVVNCDNPDDWQDTTVSEFLTDFGKSLDPKDGTKIWKLKVKFLKQYFASSHLE